VVFDIYLALSLGARLGKAALLCSSVWFPGLARAQGIQTIHGSFLLIKVWAHRDKMFSRIFNGGAGQAEGVREAVPALGCTLRGKSAGRNSSA
jgi:hypothetical protein